MRRACQALTPSQVIAVMEVRNLTDPPYKAGVELSQVIQTHVKPVPAFTELYEAAPSQSCACLYYRTDYPSLALVCQQHSLINSSLVVLKPDIRQPRRCCCGAPCAFAWSKFINN